jgi:DNA invertase Pin-like site-specific DNA recombinase
MTEMQPQNRLLGYARVSTVGQTLDSQLEQLRAAGCTAKIYREKVTGARADRRELLKMLKALAPGDVVTVTRIDRLARSTFDLFGIVKRIVDAKAQFRSLAEPWALDAGGTRRLGGRRARSYPHPYRRRQEPGAETRAAHGPETETDRGAAGRNPPPTRRRRHAC